MILFPIHTVQFADGSKGKQVDGALKQVENLTVFCRDIEREPLVAAVTLALEVRADPP